MKRMLVVLASTLMCAMPVNAQSISALTLLKTIALPGVSGKFDHFAIDLAGNRLFAAATGNHSIEVIDLNSGKVAQSVIGLGKPHGLVWVEATGSLYVADGSLGELKVYTGTPLALAGSINLSDDADDMVYDDAHHLLYVGHGGGSAEAPGRVAVVDTVTFRLIKGIPVSNHPEALDIDARGRRIFANIADSGEVAVIDGATNAIAAEWKLTNALHNVPMAYDSAGRKLYVACRTPATLLALDGSTGAEVSRAGTGEGADDLFYDAAHGRVYVISGAGEVDTFDVSGSIMQAIGVTHTAPGAKTALLVPSAKLLFVGVPGIGGKPAEIRVYSTSVQKVDK